VSLHADAVETLTAWDAPTAAQAELRDRYVAHLATRPDAMTRSCRPDHLTASTLVMTPDGSRVLLTLHAKAQAWFQFGGHCEPGDLSLAAAALREATEESGLSGLVIDPVPVQLSEHEVPFCGGLPASGERVVHHLDVRFLAIAADDGSHAVSDESLDVRWWPADALPAGAAGAGADAAPDPDIVELVELARTRL
jgi:8-oxo-dGTP pyrophosphatase MutT (NUDIX family)